MRVFVGKYQSIPSFLELTDEQRKRLFAAMRERIIAQSVEHGMKREDVEADFAKLDEQELEAKALQVFSVRLLNESVEYSAQQFSLALPHASRMIVEKVFQAIGFSGANRLSTIIQISPLVIT